MTDRDKALEVEGKKSKSASTSYSKSPQVKSVWENVY